jgi:type I site-specific restriction endonuclease
MKNTECDLSNKGFFGPVISTYSRAQAIDDGFLINAGSMACEAGFKWPVALTHGAWCDCVTWSDSDTQKQIHQDESGRVWDVLFMGSHALRSAYATGVKRRF